MIYDIGIGTHIYIYLYDIGTHDVWPRLSRTLKWNGGMEH